MGFVIKSIRLDGKVWEAIEAASKQSGRSVSDVVAEVLAAWTLTVPRD